MLTEGEKQELSAVLRDYLEDEPAAESVVEALSYVDATPTQIRKYFQQVQDNLLSIARDCIASGDDAEAAFYRNKAAKVASIIRRLK